MRPPVFRRILAPAGIIPAEMHPPALNARVREEWRDLGFFYDRDDESCRWLVIGSRAGLNAFCALLRGYAADPRKANLFDQDHFGPYRYLKIMTYAEPILDENAIGGRLEDLSRLADLVESRLASLSPGERFTIGSEYAPDAEYALEVELAPDGYDPSSADPLCQGPPER
jgi:hypothetical protein